MDKRFVGWWCLVAVSVVGVSLTVSHVVRAQGSSLPAFARPAAQGPGTQGYAVISDPTIQPRFPDGYPSSRGVSTSIDLQANGHPDIVVCHTTNIAHPPSPVPCRVLRPQPDGSVVEVTRQLFGQGALPSVIGPREIVSGDFNRDGRPDIFVADFGHDAPPFGGATNLLLLSNSDGTYSDRSLTLPQRPDNSHSASVADINGDGYLDIYVGNEGGGDVGPYFLLGRGDGTFAQKTTGLPPQIENRQQKFLSSHLVDIDGDGFTDVVLGTKPEPGYIDNVVLFNDGTGDFTARPQYLLPPGPLPRDNTTTEDIVSLDVNQDGRPDLMLLSSATRTDNGVGLQVLINQGDGTLVDETALRLSPRVDRITGPWALFIQFADFNGDGWQDFYFDTFLHEDGSINHRVWLNNGNNTWMPLAPNALRPELGIGTIHVVDFDGDGRPDILKLGGVVGDYPPDIGVSSFLNRTGLPPLAPGALTATPPGSSVTLSWRAADLATSYQVEAGSAPGLSDLFTGNVGSTTSLSATPPAGIYYARVRAVNAFGVGSPSNEVALLVGSCPRPFAPAGLSSSVSGSQVALSWTAAAGATSYVLEAGSSPGASNVFNGNVGPSTSLGAAVPSALYFLRVRGANGCGAGAASAELDVTVACPSLSPPGGFTAVVTGAAVALQWSAVPSAASYLLEAGIAPNVWNRFVGAIGPGTSFVAPNVPAGSYALRVRAQSACGVSTPSATATAVVP